MWRTLARLSCLPLIAAEAPLHAAPEARFSVHIPAGPLNHSLWTIARETGVEIGLSDPSLAGLRAGPVNGPATVRDLLKAATRGTGARFRFITPTTVMVSPKPAARMPAFPAPRPPDDLSSQQIIVTAAKREQFLSDLPMSTASYSPALRDALGLKDMRAIARVTPGVLVRNAWGGSTNLSIRGVYTNTGSATTGVYIDDTPIQTRSLGAGVTSTNVYPALFDLQRVEVLRGPQGTLFGSGSEGGTIRFITREPDLQEYSGSGAIEAFTTRGGAPGYELSVATGGPIVKDRLGFRLSAFARRDGGWVDRAAYPSGEIVARNINDATAAGVRGALTLELGKVTITPSIFYQKLAQGDLDQFWSLLSDIGAGRFVTGWRFPQPASDSFLLSTLKMVVDLPGMSLLSSTSYFRRRRPSTVDYTDYLVEQFSRGTLFSLPTLPDYSARVHFDNDQDVFTHEFRLTGADSAPIHWLIGLFLQRARQDAVETIDEPLLNEALDIIVGQNALRYFGSALLPGGISYFGNDRSIDRQLGLYGQADIPLSQTIELTAGAKLARMHYHQTNVQDGPQSGGQLRSVVSHGETPILPRVGINWRPEPGRLFYLNAARGARIGGGNPQVSTIRCGPQLAALGLTQVPDRYKSDSIWNYEAGAKLELPAIHASLQAAAFHYDWKDIQQSFSLRCLFRFTGNNAHARGDGAELSAEIRPARGLTMSAAGSYTRARYTRTTYGGVLDATTGERAVVIPEGQSLPSPKWRFSGLAHYEQPIGAALSGYITLSGDYSSSYQQSVSPGGVDYDPAVLMSEKIATARVQLGTRGGSWDASFYVDNLFDSRDAIQRTHNSRISINMRYALIRPRTVGVRVTRSWQ